MARLFLATSYRVVYALAGLAIIVLNALIDRKVVDWDPLIAVYVASGVGLVAFLDNLRLIKFKYEAHERNAARSRMYRPLILAMDSVAEQRKVRLLKLGASVFRIQ